MSPVPFVELDAPSSAAFHTKHFRRDWESLSGLWWNRRIEYCQKWQLTDDVPFQFHINALANFDTLTVNVINCKGAVVGTVQSNNYLQFAGGNYYNNVPLDTYQYGFSFAELNLPAGRYYVLITIDRGGSIRRYISEPMDVKAVWPNTLLWQYNHDENDYDVFFSLGPNFQFRVEGEFANENMSFEDSRFIDQVNRPKLIRSDRMLSCDVVLGAKTYRNSQFGIPKWLVDIAGESLRCSSVAIDNKLMVRAENATFDLKPLLPSTLCTATIAMEDPDPAAKTTFGVTDIEIAAAPASFPYALSPLTLSNGISTFALNPSNGSEIIDAAAQTAFLAGLNAIAGLNGTFSISGGYYVYSNAPGESFVDPTGMAYPKFMDFSGMGDGVFQYEYWSGSHVDVLNTGDIYYSPEASGLGNEFTDYFLDPGPFTLRMYHADNISRLVFPVPYSAAKLNKIPDALPVGMTVFEVQSHNVDELKFQTLTPARATLQTFALRNSALTTITGTPFLSAPNGQFGALTYFDLGYNAISAAEVDAVINGLFNNTGYAGGGILDLQFQSPPAPPTGASSTARIAITAAGWSLFHD
jgi:hypothetical protein